ncbi:MAG TPA: hypothetical protein VK003_07780 [Oceanobacillus sp.]|nr:hypothetical protein [Oceanobacillus sp.]
MAEPLYFSYLSVSDTAGKSALRPMLPLVLSYRGQAREAVALVDSGADVNVLPYLLGVDLGAEWSEQSTVVALSGNLANYEARGIILTAVVGEFPPVQLVFAWAKTDRIPLILGQNNFFQEFDVGFFRSQNAFQIMPNGGG